MTISTIEDDPRFILIPEHIAEKHRLRAERARQRQAERETKRAPRSHGKVPMRERKFIVWDGEGPQDTGYSLLGNSEGDDICYPHLQTEDCLQLFLESARKHPNSINVGFGFNYDVSCILRELPWRCFVMLRKFNRTLWRGYHIEHVPRKWFKITYGKESVTIFDVQSFFNSSLVGALEEWKIGPFGTTENAQSPETGVSSAISVPPLDTVLNMSESDLIRTFKKLRSEFQYKDIQQIAIYMRLELKYTKILMERLRDAFIAADYVPRSWHGPGAIARMAFQRHRVYDAMSSCPDAVAIASRFAFVAGRFELFTGGHINGPLYTADINSAYPYYCSQLPNLARGTWRHTSSFEHGKYGVYRITYRAIQRPGKVLRLHPLPYRDAHGLVSWPDQVTGWYWNPEAELVADNKEEAVIHEGWVFDEDDISDRPFAFLLDYYRLRQKYKAAGNPVEYVFKLILNSIYGQLAQRVGWDKKKNLPPKTHQLEWAGWITSSCRALVYKIAAQCGVALVSIDTDGVTSLEPFVFLTNSKELGAWKLEEFTDGIFWQSGIYYLKTGDEWKTGKTRGIPKGTYTVDALMESLATNSPLKLTKKVFVSYGLALQGRRDELNQWKTEPHEVEFGRSHKRNHRQVSRKGHARRCHPRFCRDGLHRFMLPTIKDGPHPDRHSHEHKLPWIHSKEDMETKAKIDTVMWFDKTDMDQDDEWSLDYAE